MWHKYKHDKSSNTHTTQHAKISMSLPRSNRIFQKFVSSNSFTRGECKLDCSKENFEQLNSSAFEDAHTVCAESRCRVIMSSTELRVNWPTLYDHEFGEAPGHALTWPAAAP